MSFLGGIHLPDSVTGRTFVSAWWLFCIIVVGTYCGNLIAFLTVTKDKPPFSNLQEMIDRKGEYTWGVVGGTVWETIFVHVSKFRSELISNLDLANYDFGYLCIHRYYLLVASMMFKVP